MHKESRQAASMGSTSFCLHYAEHFLPNLTRDFRELLRIHAAGLRHVVDNADGLDIKNRAYHLSAEWYLLKHSCPWFRSEESRVGQERVATCRSRWWRSHSTKHKK